jgi:hypothetical protein
MFNLPAPVFESVTFFCELVVPTFCFEKLRLDGDRLAVGAFTDWVTAAEALPVKLASPP